MKIIIGLGNPGIEYEKTRHNVGFMILTELIQNSRLATSEGTNDFVLNKKFDAEIYEKNLMGEKIILVKPQKFMNLSGEVVRKILNFFKAEVVDMAVVYDDIDLPLGTIRVREEGRSAGHRGVQNIIDEIKSDNFVRFRVGVGPISESGEIVQKSKIQAKQFVLDSFNKWEEAIFAEVKKLCVENLILFLDNGNDIKSTTLRVEK